MAVQADHAVFFADSSMNTPTDAPRTDWSLVAAELIRARQTVLPKRLAAPGPDAAQFLAMLEAAAAAPDHGQLLPWRFVDVPQSRRAELGDVFAQALAERDPDATPEQREQAREKAFRSPRLLLLVVDAARGDPEIDLAERLISAGAAVQNMLLVATAQGFGSALTSGKALKSAVLRRCFSLTDAEHAVCFISIGSVASRRPARPRPAVADYFSTLA
jgi:nitroreductase